eukprot:Gb_22972 [translate_table: standard]
MPMYFVPTVSMIASCRLQDTCHCIIFFIVVGFKVNTGQTWLVCTAQHFARPLYCLWAYFLEAKAQYNSRTKMFTYVGSSSSSILDLSHLCDRSMQCSLVVRMNFINMHAFLYNWAKQFGFPGLILPAFVKPILDAMETPKAVPQPHLNEKKLEAEKGTEMSLRSFGLDIGGDVGASGRRGNLNQIHGCVDQAQWWFMCHYGHISSVDCILEGVLVLSLRWMCCCEAHWSLKVLGWIPAYNFMVGVKSVFSWCYQMLNMGMPCFLFKKKYFKGGKENKLVHASMHFFDPWSAEYLVSILSGVHEGGFKVLSECKISRHFILPDFLECKKFIVGGHPFKKSAHNDDVYQVVKDSWSYQVLMRLYPLLDSRLVNVGPDLHHIYILLGCVLKQLWAVNYIMFPWAAYLLVTVTARTTTKPTVEKRPSWTSTDSTLERKVSGEERTLLSSTVEGALIGGVCNKFGADWRPNKVVEVSRCYFNTVLLIPLPELWMCWTCTASHLAKEHCTLGAWKSDVFAGESLYII